ncbi:hypothetical protein PMAYCL1PPCAC_07948, partial [Pristionchus mayeri]
GNDAIWTDFWSLLKEEIREAGRENQSQFIPLLLSSVAKCMPHVRKQLTECKKEFAESKVQLTDEEVDGEKKADELSRDGSSMEEHARIVRSCIRFVVDVHEAIGPEFRQVITPILPLLCSLLDEWEGDSTIEKLIEYSAK